MPTLPPERFSRIGRTTSSVVPGWGGGRGTDSEVLDRQVLDGDIASPPGEGVMIVTLPVKDRTGRANERAAVGGHDLVELARAQGVSAWVEPVGGMRPAPVNAGVVARRDPHRSPGGS